MPPCKLTFHRKDSIPRLVVNIVAVKPRKQPLLKNQSHLSGTVLSRNFLTQSEVFRYSRPSSSIVVNFVYFPYQPSFTLPTEP